jgi:hypothetical protein
VIPRGVLGIAGVTAIKTKAAGLTFNVVEPVIAPEVAVTEVLPGWTPLASPWALTVAIVELPVAQAAVLVRSRVLPSVYVPVALSCCTAPSGKVALAGVIAMETSVAGVPVPLKVTFEGLSAALSVKLSVPARDPVVCGENVTKVVQFAPAASVAGLIGHCDVKAKSWMLVFMLVMVRAEA